MNKPKITIFFLFILLLSFAWTGCDLIPSETKGGITEPVSNERQNTTEVFTLAVPTSVHTWTPASSQPTQTSTPSLITATIMPTSQPTLSRVEMQVYLTNKLSNNSGCEFPCWLGITPGESHWKEVRAFLSFLGIDQMLENLLEDGSITHESSRLSFNEPTLHHFLRILERNEVVTGVYLNVDGYNAPEALQDTWKLYSPKNILRSYGSPSRVWISTEAGDFGDRHPYDLIIAYDMRGIMIHYSGWLARTNSYFRICPRFEHGMDIQYFEISILSPNDPKSMDNPSRLQDPELISRKSKRIQEASGISEEQFADLFIHNDETVCFNTPIDIWPEFFKP